MKPTGDGGIRPMVFCPCCGNKKLKLFLKPPNYRSWECLRCHDLTHVSCKESSKPDHMFTAMCGYRVDIIRRALREIRNVRYDGDYLIETIHEIDEK